MMAENDTDVQANPQPLTPSPALRSLDVWLQAGLEVVVVHN